MSWKFFTSPFINKTHLITIILIAACFITLRLAGGNLSFKESGFADQKGSIERTDPSFAAHESEREESKTKLKEEVFNNLEAPEQEVDDRPAIGDSLSDIESALGLN